VQQAHPFTPVETLRSSRHVRVALDGVVLAESSAPVLVFETGLPTRYYFARTAVRFEHLEPSETRTFCPYKGHTSGYWSAHIGDAVHADIAWTYDFPTAALLPIAGLIAFYGERTDITIDGVAQPRPVTRFS
jgi:uncharacterized protein (DUF427 family)